MILLGDKVLDEVMMNLFRYDSNGVPVSGEKRCEQMEQDYADGILTLILSILKEEFDSFYDVLAITAEDLEKKVAHLKKRILGIFRTGVEEEWGRYVFYADGSVPDDWLFTLFLMRVRDRMIVMGAQRMHDKKFKDQQRLKEENT